MKKLESIEMDKFAPFQVPNSLFVVGGRNSPATPAGGSTCDTAGGVFHDVEYKSDTNVYNGDGSLNCTDHNSSLRAPDAAF